MSRGARLCFAPAAARDLQKISEDIAVAAGGRIALAFVERLRQSLEGLTAFPRMGRRRAGFGPGVRSLGAVALRYFLSSERPDVEIIRILHGRRRITRSLLRGG